MSMSTEWKTYRTNELIDQKVLAIGDGYRAKNSELDLTGIPFARAGNINNGFNFDGADLFPEFGLKKAGEKISRPGDVVFTSKGTVGRFAFVREETPRFVYSPQLCYWRSLNPKVIDPCYLYYWMQGGEFWLQAEGVKGQTDMADYVSLGDQRRMFLTLPPLSEQRAIARILNSLDDKIELNRRMNRILEAMAQAIFRSWFVDFEPVSAKREGRKPVGMDDATAALFPEHFQETSMGPIPIGWRVVGIGEVMKNFDSKRIPLSGSQRATKPGVYPYYGAASVMDYIDDYIFDGIYLLVGEDGSVMDDDGMAVTQYVWGKFWVNNHAHVLQGANGISTEHLMLAFQDNPILPYVTGAVQPKLNQGNMNRFPFMLPNLEVANAFDQAIRPLYQAIRARTEEAITLAKVRDTLLPQLLTGGLRVGQAEKLAEEAA